MLQQACINYLHKSTMIQRMPNFRAPASENHSIHNKIITNQNDHKPGEPARNFE